MTTEREYHLSRPFQTLVEPFSNMAVKMFNCHHFSSSSTIEVHVIQVYFRGRKSVYFLPQYY